MSHSPTVESVTKKDKLTRQNSSGLHKLPPLEMLLKTNSEYKGSNSDKNKIKLGVCAMEKKTSCKPMQEILERLSATGDILVLIFPEPMILYAPIQEWPIVDCLIAFHSTGFPVSKTEAYVELRKPYMVNELKFQDSLLWRHKMYEALIKHGIPVPKHYVVIDEKLTKKAKKSHAASCPPDNSEGSQIQQIQGLDEKFSIRDVEDNPDSKTSSRGGSFFDKEARPVIIPQSVVDAIYKEEEKSEGDKPKSDENKEKSDQEVQTMSRQHSQSSLAKMNNNDSKEAPVLRRKYSEQLILPKSTRAESVSGDESPNPDHYKGPLSNYHKKYYTKVEEHDDFIMIGDNKLFKPFVEKPLDAEDHQINIYYAKSDGGGCKSLFRKTGNISSSFDPNNNSIRRGGSFIYEVFLPTEGFDVKVYTVGPNYAHAEARKSPVLDGIVQRTKDGKEVRFPVNLTYEEKIIAKKIVFGFDQQICGFDLLRSKGKSYVCDVNGWSFVKGNAKYYTDCAMLLRAMMLSRFAPERLTPLHPMLSQLNNKKHSEIEDNLFRPVHGDKHYVKEELRSVVAIFRHGDRTPKQKMKMITIDKRYLSLFDEQGDKKKEVKLKTVKQLQKVLDITQEIIEEFYNSNLRITNDYTGENFSKHLQLFSVLKKGGHFEGINRKIQLKPLEWSKEIDPFTQEPKEVVTKGLFVLKWGGELTHSGTEQAEELGAKFRKQVYPQENEGILRLHSTYRHDLKIYSSQEGRCQKTAAAFCKGLLELEGDLTPILVSLVRKDEVTQELLEFNKTMDSGNVPGIMTNLPKLMNSDENLYEAVRKLIGEESIDSNLENILKNVGKPLTLLKKTHELVKKLAWNLKKAIATNEDTYYLSLNDLGYISPKLRDLKLERKSDPGKEENVCEEVPILIFKRWKKLENDFYSSKTGLFDLSKVPDIYYSIRYDILHSKKMVEANKDLCLELFDCSQRLAAFVIPAEYGLDDQERTHTSLSIVSNLLKKVKHDLIWWNNPFINQAQQIIKDEQSFLEHKGLDPSKVGEDVKSIWRHVRTRLYFTSASHLYSLFNVISMGLNIFSPESESFKILQRFTSLDYLSHMMIRLYENLNASHEDPNRFRLEISFSQGCKMEGAKAVEAGEHSVPITPSVVLNSQLTLSEIEQFFQGLTKLGEASTQATEGENNACQEQKAI